MRSQVLPGHEALIEGLAFDGKTTGPEAAMAVLAAEKQSRTAQAAALASDAPKPLNLTPAATVEAAPKTRADLDTAAKAYMAAHPGTDYLAAFKTVQGA